MSHHIRKPRTKRFQPSGMDWLENRLVLSAGLSTQVATAAAVRVAHNHDQDHGEPPTPPVNPGQGQESPLINQVIDQINQSFSSFATQFYQIQNAYFASFDSPSDGNAIDLATFHDRAGTLVDNLTQQVLGVVDAVPGGGGLLDGYLQARLGSDQAGSLRHALTTMPAIGTSGLSTTDFGLDTAAILQDSLLATQDLTRLYDQSLLFSTYGFFNGSLRFFNKSLYSNDLPPSSPNGTTPAAQTIDQINRYFSTFAQNYRNARTQYFQSIGTSQFGAGGDIQSYRTSIDQALTNLTNDVVNAVRSVSGGAGPLSSLLIARLGGDQAGSLRHDLMNEPPVGTSGLTRTGFALTGETYLGDALLTTQNSIRLYNDSLNYVAEGFFNAFAGRFLRGGPTGNGTGVGDPVGQVSARRGGLVRAQAQTFLPRGPYGFGNVNSGFDGGLGYFNSAPFGFNVNNGFGGLGSGFDSLNPETGAPVTTYGTGFGPFGLGTQNVNRGYNPLIGVNPAFGGGFGTTYGVIGPSFSTGFATGIGGLTGFGVTPGLGGFFF